MKKEMSSLRNAVTVQKRGTKLVSAMLCALIAVMIAAVISMFAPMIAPVKAAELSTESRTADMRYIPEKVSATFDLVLLPSGANTTILTKLTLNYDELLVLDKEVPTFDGYQFAGWFTDLTYATDKEWDLATDKLQDDIVLYAKWNLMAPVITAQPQDINVVFSGEVQTLSVTASHQIGMTYQWYKTSAKDTEGTAIQGSVSPSIDFYNVSDSAFYYCVISVAGQSLEKSIKSNVAQLTITPKELTITANSAEKVFDGLELRPGYTLSTPLAADHILIYTDVAVTNVAKDVVNTITDYSIKLPGGKDVTSNYTITTVDGKITVTAMEVNISYGGLTTKFYDGTALTADYASDMPSGFTFEMSSGLTITSVGEVKNQGHTAKIFFNGAEVDAANISAINIAPITLKIEKRPITLTAASSNRTYNGENYADGAFTSGLDQLMAGHRVFVSMTAESVIKFAGKIENMIDTVKIVNLFGVDVTDQYDIAKVNGELTINPKNITVTSASGSKVYNGKPFILNLAAAGDNELIGGDFIVTSITTSITNAGSMQNAINGSMIKVMKGDRDVTDCYNMTFVNGTITVSPREITVLVHNKFSVFGSADAPLTCVEKKGIFVGKDIEKIVITREEGANPGEYKITAALDDENYVVTFIYEGGEDSAYGIYRILQKDLSLSINDSNIAADEVKLISAGGEGVKSSLVVSRNATNSVKYSVKHQADFTVRLKQVYELNIMDGGKSVQPNGYITVKIKIDENLRKIKNLGIIYIDENGNATVLDSVREGDYLSFSVNHMSTFGIVDLRVPAWFIILITVLSVLVIGFIVLMILRAKYPYAYNTSVGWASEKLKVAIPEDYLERKRLIKEQKEQQKTIKKQEEVISQSKIILEQKDTIKGLQNQIIEDQKNTISQLQSQIAAGQNAQVVYVAAPSSAPAPAAPVFKPVVVEADEPEEEETQETIESVEQTADGNWYNEIEEYYDRSYASRIHQTTDEIKEIYSNLKNKLISGVDVKAKASWKGERFYVGKHNLAKIKMMGRTIYIYLALDVAKTEGGNFKDMSENPKFAETPALIKIKGKRKAAQTEKLIDLMFTQLGMTQQVKMNIDYKSMYDFRDDETLISDGLIKVKKRKAKKPITAQTVETLLGDESDLETFEEISDELEETDEIESVEEIAEVEEITEAETEEEISDVAATEAEAVETEEIELEDDDEEIDGYEESYQAKICFLNRDKKWAYEKLKNSLMSLGGVRNEISWKFESFYVGDNEIARIRIAHSCIYIYLALKAKNISAVVDCSKVEDYAHIPARYKVKNAQRVNYAYSLIDRLVSENGLKKDKWDKTKYSAVYSETNIDKLIEKGWIKSKN